MASAERPAGYHTLTPRIAVPDVEAQVRFLREVFGATGDVVEGRPAEVRVGDSLLLVAPDAERGGYTAHLYVYVSDVEHTYQRALVAGAESLEAPLDTPYGDRRAMVQDPWGNVFQIARRLETAREP